VPGRGRRGRQLSPGEVEKVRGELERYRRFAELSEQIVEVNEAICEARPAVSPPKQGRLGQRGRKRGLCAALAEEFTAEVERLAGLAAWALGAEGGGLAAVELAIREAMLRLGGSLLEGLLAADEGYRGPRTRCGAGHQARFVSCRDKAITTVVGPIRLRRAYYHCARCRHGVIPRDGQLGIRGQSMSVGLAKMIARAGAAVPFARAAGLLAELAGVHLGAKRVERCAEAGGAAAAAAGQAETKAILTRRLVPLPPSPLPDKLYIAIDGTGVPMLPAETQGRAGKGPHRRARTREVKLACLFTQAARDPQAPPIRDPGSASYLATFEPAAAFGQLTLAEARRRGSDHIRQIIILGDGAHWIWNQANTHFPEATQIVDLYHAREHLYEIAALLAPTLGNHYNTWLTQRLTELDAGNIPALIAAARQPLPRDGKCHTLDKALPYFETNAHRMQYAHFRELGMFVGSGTVEAACKSIIGQRLKLSGMRWSLQGANSIIALHCAQASQRWDTIWPQDHNQTPAA
jgi:hypothetical protein